MHARDLPAAEFEHPTRRHVLAGSAALAATVALGPPPAIAQTAPYRFKIGAAEITMLSDGAMAAPLGWVLPDRAHAEIADVLKAAGRSPGDFALQVNVTLVKLGAALVLIDAGSGPDFAPARGKLADNLEKAGIKPEAITHVVFTHAHPDHLWGVIDPLDGGTMFTNAKHLLPAAEHDYWLKSGVEATVPEAVRGGAIGTQRRLKELGQRIETTLPGSEILPGLALVDSAGHTPGHVCVHLRSGTDQLMIGGDALIEPVISFARPAWPWGPDWDKDRAVLSRRRLLDMLSTDKIPLVGYHLPWPGLGRVERSGGNYRFVQS